MVNTVYLLSWVTGVCALWLLWSFAWRGLALAFFREALFELRFRLFRLGMDGELSFDNEAYRSIETLICGLLRYGHRISFLTYLFSRREQERAKKEKDYVDVGQQVALKVSRLQPGTQEKIAKILVSIRHAIVLYMAFSSLFLLAMIFLFRVLKVFGWGREPNKAKLTGVIEQEAYRIEARRSMRLAAA
jgi:hypothetical protein